MKLRPLLLLAALALPARANSGVWNARNDRFNHSVAVPCEYLELNAP